MSSSESNHKKIDKKVVTRFAPSPTGNLHVGGVRSALFTWAFAQQHNGTFILRIEDTDKEREVEGSIEQIIKTLQWLGILWNEGPDIGGPNGPYLQSQRLDTYKKYADILVQKGLAYADPYTKEQLDEFRAEAEIAKKPFLYRDYRPEHPPIWDGSQPLRLKITDVKSYEWNDLVRGTLSAGPEALDDFILMKSDGYPTYNFAHIIDDLYMQVTHVFRADEYISSTPKFLALYEALGIERPEFATLPPIMGPDGKKKLSKRDNVKDTLAYKDEGYLPEALINFLAFIGWNPGTDTEILTPEEFITLFDITKVQKSGGALNEEKLTWINKEHIKKLSDEEFKKRVFEFIPEELKEKDNFENIFKKMIPTLRERISFFGEIKQMQEAGELDFYFEQPEYATDLLWCPEKLRKGIEVNAETMVFHFSEIKKLLEKVSADSFNAESIKNAIWDYATEKGRGIVLWPLRICLSGKERSPDPVAIADILGKEQTLTRIDYAIKKLTTI